VLWTLLTWRRWDFAYDGMSWDLVADAESLGGLMSHWDLLTCKHPGMCLRLDVPGLSGFCGFYFMYIKGS
jgi:hypothetical protein